MPTHDITPPLRHTIRDNSQEKSQEPFWIEKGSSHLSLPRMLKAIGLFFKSKSEAFFLSCRAWLLATVRQGSTMTTTTGISASFLGRSALAGRLKGPVTRLDTTDACYKGCYMSLDMETTDDFDASKESWFDDYASPDDEMQIDEYDITAAPNDFNITTIFSFLESGSVTIPAFQRNYVWDLKRASKLIESIIIGLPVPQIFLYEERRNKFLVIDGQQRLMSIYYFMKQRFPRKEKRVELRHIFDEHSAIPGEVLSDDTYFTKFNLQLPEKMPGVPNRFKGRNYLTLEEYKTQFDLRTIRNIIVKQNSPQDDDSSIYEIFNRLNSGGVNLRPQEIRLSLYHSEFFDMLYRANPLPAWRRVLGLSDPDLHVKDIEVLLRGFAMLIDGAQYAPSMTKFLNRFSKHARGFNKDENGYLEKLLHSFLESCSALPEKAFMGKRTRKFNLALFEAVFYAVCYQPFQERTLITRKNDPSLLVAIDNDPDFINASQKDTTGKSNVSARLRIAKQHLDEAG